MKVKHNKFYKIILALNILGLVCLIILANINSGLLKNIEFYNSKIKKPVSQESLDNLKIEINKLEKKFLGLSDIFGPLKDQEKIVDKAVFFAQKVDSLEKRLLRKAEMKGALPPQIEVPRNLPSQQEASYLIRQIEVLEKAVDLGLKAGLDFTSIKLLGLSQEENYKKLGIELTFRGLGPDIAKYILSLTEFIPLLNIENFTSKKEEAGFICQMKITKFLVDKKKLSLVPQGILPFDYKNSVTISNDLKQEFLESKIFEEIKQKEILITPKPVKKIPKKAQRFFYRGRGNLEGKEVAALEDSLREEVLFLERRDKIGDFQVKDFSENKLILENIKTGKRLILKREVE